MTAARKLWTDEHQRQLKGARLAAGVSDVAFSRDNVITLRHLQQLEEGGSTAFYSESIKYDMGTKLLKRLGVEPRVVAVEPETHDLDEPASSTTPLVRAASVPAANTRAAPADAEADADADANARSATRIPYIVLSLVGVGLIGAGISSIPSIHQPGATQGVAQTSPADTGASTAAPVALMATVTLSPEAASAQRVADKPSGQVPTDDAVTVAGSASHQTAPASSDACDPGGASQTIVPSQPSKAADYVYLTAVSEVTLCVRDATGRITRKTLQAGQSFNIAGRQPFDVTADQLAQLRVFFQGQRIWFRAESARLRLTAATASD